MGKWQGFGDNRPAAQKGKGEPSKISPDGPAKGGGPAWSGKKDDRPSAGSGKANV